MKQLTKAQLTIGILSYFAIVWALFENLRQTTDAILDIATITIVALVVMLILSFIILGILEWVKIFDLKTNAILTLITLMTFGLSLLLITGH